MKLVRMAGRRLGLRVGVVLAVAAVAMSTFGVGTAGAGTVSSSKWGKAVCAAKTTANAALQPQVKNAGEPKITNGKKITQTYVSAVGDLTKLLASDKAKVSGLPNDQTA